MSWYQLGPKIEFKVGAGVQTLILRKFALTGRF